MSIFKVFFPVSLIFVKLSSLILDKPMQLGMIVSRENENKFSANMNEGFLKAIQHNGGRANITYNLVSTVVDVCDGVSGARAVLFLRLNQSVDAVFGSFCSAIKIPKTLPPICDKDCLSSAQVADYWDLPYFATECIDPTLDNSSIYTTSIRLYGSLTSYGSALLAFFARNNWMNCAIVNEMNNDFCKYAMTAIKKKFDGAVRVSEFLEVNNFFPDGEMAIILSKISFSARIIIVCHSNASTLASLMRSAYRRGMTDPNEYAWITLYNVYYKFDFNMLFIPWFVTNDSLARDELMQAFLSVKALTYKNYTRLPDPNTNLTRTITSKTLQLDILADSVYLYFTLVIEAMRNDEDPFSGKNILNLSRGKELENGATDKITMNLDGDRLMTFTVWSLSRDSSMFKPYLNINITDGNYTPILVGRERWGLSSRPPLDRPICDYDNKYCKNDGQPLIIGMVVFFVLLFIILIIFLVIRSFVVEQKIQNMLWKVKFSDLEFFKKNMNLKGMPKSSLLNITGERTFPHSFRDFQDTADTQGVMVALYKEMLVTVNYSSKTEVDLTKKDLVELVKAFSTDFQQMKDLQHDNIIHFIGACIETDRICFLTQYCSRGSLQQNIVQPNILKDMLADVQTPIDWTFKLSFITDLTKACRDV
ncbi:hypothetical protein HELRODRAFT_171190 [Helobdella robusta]|uniref:Uncharacterized protein n=1 Tax=Helobdella robusta TaxID=6412 RepID=T1F3X0_HELRO|nr:hypothetical protein HELRODRAFT_171190 [Helobdella robusta]ESO05550.1 hypothetical protein HELRODRAFT_171190 [Helobdella robusta]